MRNLFYTLFFICPLFLFGQYVEIDKQQSDYTLQELKTLESFPGAPNVIWISVETFFGFDSSEGARRRVLKSWLHVAERFRPFNVNVTTSKAVWDATPTSNKIIFKPSLTLGGGGQCSLFAWGGGANVTCNGSLEYYVVAHEVGHGMGLRHSTGTNYINNGASYGSTTMAGSGGFNQWAIGLDERGNFQDEISILSSKLGFRPDDHANTDQGATPISINQGEDTVRAQNNVGVIEQDGDIDVFSFTTTGGSIDLFVNPLKYFNGLHVKTTLHDSNGNLVLNGTPIFHYAPPLPGTNTGTSRRAKQGTHLNGILAAGTYYIRVTNTGYLDGTGSGYTTYGSLGYYEIFGNINTVQPKSIFIPSDNLVCANANTSITFKNNSLGGNENVYEWSFENANIASSSLVEPTAIFNIAGEHKVTLKVTNSAGTSISEQTIIVGDVPHKLHITSDRFHDEVLVDRFTNSFDEGLSTVADDLGAALKVIANGKNVYTKTAKDFTTVGLNEELNICLLDSCYDITVFEPFRVPNKSTDQTAPCGVKYYGNGQASLGEKVVHNGVIWELVGSYLDGTNKPIVPSSSSSSWDSIGLCISIDTSAHFTITNNDDGVEYIRETHRSLELSGGKSYSNTYCVGKDLPPVASFEEHSYACVGSSHTFANNSKGSNNSYLWTFEGTDIQSSTLKNPTVKFTTPGKHKVSLKATNSGGVNLMNKWVFVGDVSVEFAVTKTGFNDVFVPPFGSARKGLLLNIYNGGNQLLAASAKDFKTKSSDTNFVVLEMCLTDECYTIDIEDAFEPATCGRNQFNFNKVYNNGDECYYKGKIYKAKWYTQREAPPGPAWELVQNCTSTNTNVFYQLYNTDTGDTILQVNQKTYDSTNVATGLSVKTDQFCIGQDQCPNDPNKVVPGICGCGVPDIDTDADGVPDCLDQCPNDFYKTSPGNCGCNKVEDVSCKNTDQCPNDPNKTVPGVCGCGVADTDTDNDGTADCNDLCPNDPNKVTQGTCGCGMVDIPGCVTSVYSVEGNSLVKFYPNPFSNSIIIKWDADRQETYRLLITTIGGAVVNNSVHQGNELIQIGENWSKGVYLAYVQSSNSERIIEIQRIVKY